MTHDYTWFAIFVALNGLNLLILGAYISYVRFTQKIANGDGGFKPLKKAIRAHGNAVEHTTIFALEILALTYLKLDSKWLGVLVIAFTLMRVFHAYGMLKPNFTPRRIGAGVTFLLQGIAVIVLFCLMLGLM